MALARLQILFTLKYVYNTLLVCLLQSRIKLLVHHHVNLFLGGKDHKEMTGKTRRGGQTVLLNIHYGPAMSS